jgi:hypothetical protein
MAADDHNRASYVHDGDEFRDDMGRHFAGRPRAERVRVDAVEAAAPRPANRGGGGENRDRMEECRPYVIGAG